MRAALIILGLVCGCRQLLGFEEPIRPDASDAGTGAECGWTFAPDVIGNPCDLVLGTELKLSAGIWIYDTSNGELEDPGGIASTPPSTIVAGDPATRVLATMVLEIEPSATLEVRGTHALAIVVDTNATIDGAIDVSATSIGNTITPGPGGDAAGCATRTGGNGGNALGTMDGGGGGGGGGFGTEGGAGSVGGGASQAPAGMAGAAADEAFAMRGGCRGGVGGIANNVAGVAGAGGGALLLVVKNATAVRSNAELRSAGSGALPGRENSGGSGGGSGGLLVIETPTLVISGSLCANGGGGAGGSTDATFGGIGESGTCSATVAALGGAASNNNTGGDGGFGTTPPQAGSANEADNDGSGGGGGAVGRIFLRAASLDNTGTVSPPPVALPF